MPDQTARDAVAGSIFNATFTAEWDDCPDGYQETRAMILRDADAILAALGIPPDATTDDVRAGLARIEHPQISTTHRIDGTWEAWMPTFDGYGRGASPAAAVLALANKLEEQK